MEITYQLRKEDLLALTDDLTKRSPTARRIVRRTVATSLLASALMCWGIWVLTRLTAAVLMIFVVTTLLTALIPFRIKRNQRRTTASLYGEGRNRALFLPKTMSIDRDFLCWSAESGSGNVKFEYLERVSRSDTYLLIYLNVRFAYVVPRDGVVSGDFDAFASEVERRWKKAMDLIAEPHEAYSM
jgi:hypothetical protein